MRYLEDEQPKEKQSIWLTIAEWWDCDYDSPIRHLKRIVYGIAIGGLVLVVTAIIQTYPFLLGIVAACGMLYAIGLLVENYFS